MNTMKKLISILCIMLMCSNLIPSVAVFAADGVVTEPSDYFAANALDNVVGEDYQTTFAQAGSVTITANDDNSVTFSVVGNATSQNRKAISGNWTNSGYTEITFDYQFNGTIPDGGTYTHQINLHIGAWFNGPVLKNDGSKYTVKAVMDLGNLEPDGKAAVVYYEKSYGADDSEYVQVAKSTNTAPSDMSVLQPHWKVATSNYPDDTTVYNGMTIDNFNISEKPLAEIDLQELTGVNYSTEDNVEVNFFLPAGYTTADLKINDDVVATYTPEDYTAGSYKATIPLTGCAGEDVSVELVAMVDEIEQAKSTTIDKVTDPSARTLELNDISGRDYTNAEELDIEFYLPVAYTSATLKIDGTTVKTYTPDEYPERGVYTDSISLSEFEGENVSVELSAVVNGITQTVNTTIDNIEDVFVPAINDFSGGIYLDTDSVDISVSLPEGYTTAGIKVGDSVVCEYSSETSPAGEYVSTLDLSGFSGVDIPVELYAVVNGREKRDFATIDEIVSVTNYSIVAEEDFSDTDYELTIYNGIVEDGVLTDDTTGGNHVVKKNELTIPNGYCADIEYDVKLTGSSSVIGAFVRGYEKNSTDNYFPKQGGWFYTQSNGIFSVNESVTYELNEWNNVRYRLFANRDLMYVYVNGVYIGSRPMEECLGFSEIGTGWNTGGSKIYIDNVKITSWTSFYSVSATAIDADGQAAELIYYDVPKIKLDFNMAMNEDTLTPENITITSFNGRNIAYTKTYDNINKDLILIPDETLIPDKEYTISISSNVKSLAGISNEDNQFVIRTEPQPLRLEMPSVNLGGINDSTSSVSVPISVECSAADNATVFVVLYCDGKMVSMKTTKVVNGVLSEDSVSLVPAGAGDYKLALYMCDGINDYNAIDDIVITE